ncbi:MAG: nuclear transport factor 2 family protein [Kofleriaceae bacterium]
MSGRGDDARRARAMTAVTALGDGRGSARLGAGAALAAALALVACGNAARRVPPPLADQVSGGDRDARQSLINELQIELLDSYERDEPPELDTAVLPVVGAARVGVGPGDVLVAQELDDNASSRWPLTLSPSTPSTVRSKRLRISLAQDRSAAWISDEVSWRIEVCGHTLTIPLRLTALFARDGDRWVMALEHLSTGVDLAAQGELMGRSIPPAEASAELAAAVATSVTDALRVPLESSPRISTEPDSLLLGPGWFQEWRGDEGIGQRWVDGALAIAQTTDGGAPAPARRVGAVGRSVDSATVAYWVGNLTATTASQGRARLRASFVLERRNGVWVVVQGHVSAPVDDQTLARAAIGSALVSLEPLVTACDERAPSAGAAAP